MNEIIRVSSPPNFHRKIAEELNSSLESDKRALLKLISLSEFLCCLSVLNGERVCGRICASGKNADRAVSLINAMGLYCHRSMFDLMPQPDVTVGKNITHHAIHVPKGSQQGAWAVLYFGIDAEFAEGAEAAELNKEQRLVGRLFGYPECCSEFFLQNNGSSEDRTSKSIPDVGPFPSILNPLVAELYGLSLQFHFACSPRCSRSLEILKSRMKYLTRYSPSIAQIENLGSGLALYGPSIGASLVTRYRKVEPRSYELEETITWSDKAADLYAGNGKATRLYIHSAHEFMIGDRIFCDDNHFTAVFSRNEDH